MSASIEYLTDKENNILLPKTVTKAVYDENGNRLDRTLSNLNAKIGFSYSVSGNNYEQVIENIITVAISRYGDSFDTITGTGDWQGINWTYITLTKKGGVTHGIFHIADGKLIAFSKIDGQSLNIANDYASNKAISDAYNPSKTYAQGQYCIYNNTLWRSKLDNNAGNTPEESSYWTATNVGKNLVTTNGEGKFGYLGADGSFIPFKSGGEEPVLLWENPNPNSGFTAQKISLDLSEYASIIIEAGRPDYTHTFSMFSVGSTSIFWSGFSENNGGGRKVTVTNDGVNISNAIQMPNGVTANHQDIPCKIWGVPTEFEVVTKNIAIQEWLTASITTAYTITKDYEYVTILSGNTVTFSGNIGETLVAKQQIIGNSSYYYYIFKDVKSGTKFTPASTSYGMQITAIPYV